MRRPFLENLVSAGIVAAVGASAHVAVVGPVHAVEQQPPPVEYGPYDGDVRQVAAAKVGVIKYEKVALGNTLPEVVPRTAAPATGRALMWTGMPSPWATS